MSLKNYLNKMKSHKQDINTKLSYWEIEKQKGSKGETITRNFLRKYGLNFNASLNTILCMYINHNQEKFNLNREG